MKVAGYRYGKAPSSGRSYNHAENRCESGVSMANVLNIYTIQSFAANENKKVYYYLGDLVEDSTGGDSEYLMTNLVNITKKQYKEYCNQMTGEKRILIENKIKSLEETLSYYRSNYGWHKMMDLFEEDLKYYQNLL